MLKAIHPKKYVYSRRFYIGYIRPGTRNSVGIFKRIFRANRDLQVRVYG